MLGLVAKNFSDYFIMSDGFIFSKYVTKMQTEEMHSSGVETLSTFTGLLIFIQVSVNCHHKEATIKKKVKGNCFQLVTHS